MANKSPSMRNMHSVEYIGANWRTVFAPSVYLYSETYVKPVEMPGITMAPSRIGAYDPRADRWSVRVVWNAATPDHPAGDEKKWFFDNLDEAETYARTVVDWYGAKPAGDLELRLGLGPNWREIVRVFNEARDKPPQYRAIGPNKYANILAFYKHVTGRDE